jgi:hypothetical protein
MECVLIHHAGPGHTRLSCHGIQSAAVPGCSILGSSGGRAADRAGFLCTGGAAVYILHPGSHIAPCALRCCAVRVCTSQHETMSVEWGLQACAAPRSAAVAQVHAWLLQPQENGHSHHSAEQGSMPAEALAAPKHVPWETVYDGKDASAKVAALTSPFLRVLGRSNTVGTLSFSSFQHQLCHKALHSVSHSVVSTLRSHACAGFDRCVAWNRTSSMLSGCGLRLTRVQATGAVQLCWPRLRWVPVCLEVCSCVLHVASHYQCCTIALGLF